MNIGGHLVDVSPLSTIGALCLAGAPADESRAALQQAAGVGPVDGGRRRDALLFDLLRTDNEATEAQSHGEDETIKRSHEGTTNTKFFWIVIRVLRVFAASVSVFSLCLRVSVARTYQGR